MRRAIRRTVWAIAAIIVLPLLAAALALFAANTPPGREWIERTVSALTAGETTLTGLSGRFPDTLRLGRLELRDSDGLWLAADGLALDWSPHRLLAGTAWIDRLEAGHIALDRLPNPKPDETGSTANSLPVGIILHRLQIARLDLGAAVAGKPFSLAVDGKANLASLEQGDIGLALKRLDGEGKYTLEGNLKDTKVHARLSVQESAQGLIASYADFQGLDGLSAEATVEGPLSALQTRLTLTLGPLQAGVQGELDLEHDSADVTVNAKAPAMQLRPGLSWQAVSLDAKVRGPFTRPTADGTLRIDKLNAANAVVRRLAVSLQGDAGQVQVRGELAGLRLPGPQPDLLEAAPLDFQADIRLDAPQRPVVFRLNHPLIAAEGKADTAASLHGELTLNLPDLKPLAALGGLDVQGQTRLNLRAAMQGETTQLDVDGILSVTGGMPPLPDMLGNAAKIGVSATLRGEDVALTRFSLDGKTLAASADGKLASRSANFNWVLSLKDLADVLAGGSGQIAAHGQIAGPLDKFAVTADLNGEMAAKGLPRGPIAVKLRLEGLPAAPVGQLTMQGALGGSPIDLALTAKAPSDGIVQLTIDSALWKSAHAKGNLTLLKGSSLPLGKIDLDVGHLEDLRPILSQPLAGSATATLETSMQGNQPMARLQLDALHAGLDGIALVGRTTLVATLADPIGHPVIAGQIDLDGISAKNMDGSARLELDGPLEALKLRLSAAIGNLAGSEVRLDSAATFDIPHKGAEVYELKATWKEENVHLLAPVRIAFADGFGFERLRLGLRQAELELAGRVSPALNLTVALDNLPADLTALVAPDLPLTGTLRGEARLGGTLARPTGILDIEAADLHLRTGVGRALPSAKLTATAQLLGIATHLEARLSAGPLANLSIGGEAPLTPSGQFDLRANGGLDLKLLDPLLTASGRRLRGQIILNAGLAGTLANPVPTGSVQLTGGEVQDFAIGAHLTHLTALLQTEGGTVSLSKLEGRAGTGTVSADGSVDLQGEGMPVNLTLTARKARLLADDRMTVNLNAGLTVQGQARGKLALAGTLLINRAEIRIPERMPAKIAVLNVARPGMSPPPPLGAGPDVALDLSMEAPGEIFVRGRGVDAELGGKIHVRGTVARPQPDGGFALRRGQFAIAGQTLNFSKGEVGFDGGSLTDPSLNFVANTASGNVTATLTVGGTAGNPKIKLSSVPDLPQDEVLARLLFGRSATSLSPLELFQIASAVASLTGVTSGIGDPLESVRKGLGLDRLSIGGTNPSLEAGRYVAPGVYVGAKQGITGIGTQATVQIDICKGLKVEGTAGTGLPASGASGTSGTNSVGIIYQHEY